MPTTLPTWTYFQFLVILFFLHSQNETYREEFLNERKEKERALSLKDKLKRDLENYQSRISSLQEQVRSVPCTVCSPKTFLAASELLQYSSSAFPALVVGALYDINICATSGDLVFELSFFIIRIQLKNMSDIRYAPYSHLLAEKTNKQKKGVVWNFKWSCIPKLN